MASTPKFKEQGERLKLLLIHVNMTARDLARFVSISENTVYKICSGLDPMSDRTASKICYFLEKRKGIVVDKQWLLTGEGEMIVKDKPSVGAYPEDDNGVMLASEDVDDGIDWKAKYLGLLEEHSRLQNKMYELLLKMIKQ